MRSLLGCLFAFGAGLLMVSCGGLRSQSDVVPIDAPSVLPATPARGASVAYRVLHRFNRQRKGYEGRGGALPYAGLVDVNGTLYGTTADGGANRDGTVYSISRSGAKKTLYSFRGGATDGSHPRGPLLYANGTLYGTTSSGGNATCAYQSGCGTVFSVTPTGVETVLYKFQGGPDGAHPVTGLIAVKGTLYGTTAQGGGNGCINSHVFTYGCGTVYSVTPSGTESVVYAFPAFVVGDTPNGLIADHGVLYGTTRDGGTSGCGTFFKISKPGSEEPLHNFSCYADFNPAAGLTDVRGTIYGATEFGGANGFGTVFRMSTNGTERVLHNFLGVPDGALPNGGLAYLDGTLYGTTIGGGSSTCNSPSGAGCGTIFSLTTDGSETVLHQFQGGSDGSVPLSFLVGVNGTLYGTTPFGGGSGSCARYGGHGCGTVFALTP